MFCFITSLRSARVSKDWERTCALLERTAISVFNQTTPNIRLVIVGHEPPAFRTKFDERLEFIAADVPVPHRSGLSPEQYHLLLNRDKNRKLTVGLRRARELNADFMMPIDADDLVSRRLAAHVMANPEVDGWFVQRGWRHKYGWRWLETLDGFNLVSSSGNILSRRWFAFPGQPEREQQVENDLFVEGHTEFVRVLGERGAVLRPIPFRAAVYIVAHGENISEVSQAPRQIADRRPWFSPRRIAGNALRTGRTVTRRRLLAAKIRNEFAIEGALAG